MTFTQKLKAAVATTGSVLCVGLDPDPERFPQAIKNAPGTDAEKTLEFCRIVIRQTKGLAAAYKPNLGFFEALGAAGIGVFEELCRDKPEDVIWIADAKRGDIGNTAHRYKTAFFQTWNCDAVTLSPLMGADTLTPFLTDASRAVFALTLTSNPGADDFFDQKLQQGDTLSERIAATCAVLDERFPASLGMVLGATRPDKMASLLTRHPNAHLLIPGVGTQGGSIQALTEALHGHRGIPLVNVSRAILFSGNPETEKDFAGGIAERALYYQELLKPLAVNSISSAEPNV
ncbi:MAG: orotidine 5'-phosphate decarboxylase PyrF [Bacteroidetes bacterium HLUCCA01]|nr:MAG: orotidine 5'-phosphate decarboxylase PyrF [Bacteroidetes bacterium HLUCCA01]